MQCSTNICFLDRDHDCDLALEVVAENPEFGLVMGIPEGVDGFEKVMKRSPHKILNIPPFAPFPAARVRTHVDHLILRKLGGSQDLRFSQLIATASQIGKYKARQVELKKAVPQICSLFETLWAEENAGLSRKGWKDESESGVNVKAMLEPGYRMAEEIATQEMSSTCQIMNIAHPEGDLPLLNPNDGDQKIK
jgi:hypothetical protein